MFYRVCTAHTRVVITIPMVGMGQEEKSVGSIVRAYICFLTGGDVGVLMYMVLS